MKSFSTPSDVELIERAKQGDNAAFRMLVNRHEHQVRSIVIGMLGKTVEADDVAQEVFIRFYRSLGDFRGEAALSTYLSRIAINLSLNEIKRRENCHMRLAFFQGEHMRSEQADNCVDPERHDIRDSIQKALKTLEPDFRIIIILRLIEGYSVRETAEMLQLPQGTVASRLARAQEKMKDILKKWSVV